MRPANDRARVRIHPAVVVTGITLGILALLFLQAAIPYVLGPWGLVVVGLLDVAIYLELRRRRAAKRRPHRRSLIDWGPVDPRYVVRGKMPLDSEVAAMFAIGVFIALLYVIGFAVRIEFWWISQNIGLYILGSIMTTFAVWLRLGIRTDYPSESELFDTTEDH